VRKNFRKGKCIAWVMVKTKGKVNIMSYICRKPKRNNIRLEKGVVEIQTKLDTRKMKQED
jgi:translation initiation factor IF-1